MQNAQAQQPAPAPQAAQTQQPPQPPVPLEADAQALAERIRAQVEQAFDQAQTRSEIRDAVRDAQREARQAREAHGAVGGGRIVVPPMPGQTFTLQPPFGPDVPRIPPEVVQLATMFFVTLAVIVIGLPLARAIGRWLDRRSRPAQIPADVAGRLERIEQAVEAVAIEVERISEAQRYTAKLLTERVREPVAGGRE